MDYLQELWQDWPCHLVTDAERLAEDNWILGCRGRYLVASQTIPAGQVILLSEAYLTALLPSYKKRVCQFCLHVHSKRLNTYCRDCNQCWYCNTACKAAHHMGSSQHSKDSTAPIKAHTAHLVPHRLTCAVLKRFASIKCDPAMESVIRMLLDAMALQCSEDSSDIEGITAGQDAGLQSTAPHRQDALAQQTPESLQGPLRQSTAAAQQQAKQPQLPLTSHHHLMLLQSHAADFTVKDRKDWLVNLRFLRNAMQQANWPRVWSEEALLEMVGRIASNNFGIYYVKQRQTPEPSDSVQQSRQQQPAGNLDTCQQCQGVTLPSVGHDSKHMHAQDDNAVVNGQLEAQQQQQQQATGLQELLASCTDTSALEATEANGAAMHKPLLLWPMQEALTDASLHHPVHSVHHKAPDIAASQSLLLRRIGEETTASEHTHAVGHHPNGALHQDCAVTGGSVSGPVNIVAPRQEASSQGRGSTASKLAKHNQGTQTATTYQHRQHEAGMLRPEGTAQSPNTDQTGCADSVPVQASDRLSMSHASFTAQLPADPVATSKPHLAEAMQQHDADTSNGLDYAQATQHEGSNRGKEDVIGREMFITASFFNHSCDPNCMKTREPRKTQGIAAVTALTHIEAGEPLTISYIDLELPRSARQLELKTSFFFDCKCSRCERELTEGSKKCSYTQKQTAKQCQAPKRRGSKARVSRS